MNNPKVSVLTPIYNHKIEYVEQCLESLKNQTMQEIEFILIDNGATQESKDLIEKYVNLDSRFRAIHLEENKGYGGAINAGLSDARGEFVAIVESDDFCETTMYEDLSKKLEASSADFLISDFFILRDSINFKFDVHHYLKTINEEQIISLDTYPQIMLQGAFPWNKLYRKSFLNKHSLKMREDNKVYHDITWNAEILSCSNNILYINTPYYFYRYDTAGSTTNIGDLSTLNYIYKKNDARDILIENGKFVDDIKEWFWCSCLIGCDLYFKRLNKKFKAFYYKEMSKFFKLALKDKCEFKYFNSDQKKYFLSIVKYPYILWRFNKNKKRLIQGLFSIKNHENKIHKQITIMGIKIKIKKKTKIKNYQLQDFQRLEKKVTRLLELVVCDTNISTIAPANGDYRLQQLSSLGILKKLVPFMQEHNINYWLEFGTLLGAVRHKGFIPWDDDIDIALPKKDYDRLRTLLPLFCKEGFYFSDGECLRVSYKSSLAQVDIFPFYSGNSVELPNEEETLKLTTKMQQLYDSRPVIRENWENLAFKKKSVLPNWYKNLIPQIYREQILENKEIPEKAYMFLGYECFAYKRVLCAYDEIFPLKQIEFEGELFNCPNQTYMHLHNYWGDFYKFPAKISGHRFFKSPINTIENYKDTMDLIDG